jgi:hypothetical protein
LPETIAHAEQLHPVVPELCCCILDGWPRHVQAVFVYDVVVVCFTLIKRLRPLLQSEPERVLQPVQRFGEFHVAVHFILTQVYFLTSNRL